MALVEIRNKSLSLTGGKEDKVNPKGASSVMLSSKTLLMNSQNLGYSWS